MNKKIIVTLFATILAGFCLYYLIFNFEWLQIWKVMRQANWLAFLLYSSLTITLYWLARTLRWRVLLPDESKSVPFLKLYFYTVFSVSLSSVTPFQAGEALKVELVQRENSSRFSTYAIFAFERGLDLFVVLILALVGLNGEIDPKFVPYIYLTLLCLSLGGLTVLAIIFFVPHKKLHELREKIITTWRISVIIQAVMLTIISWMLVALGWKLALQQIMIDLSITQSFTLVSLGAIINVISFVPGAVGVSEVGTTQILTFMGYEPSLAQAGAVIIRGYMLVGLFLALIQCLFPIKILSYRKNNKLNKQPELQKDLL